MVSNWEAEWSNIGPGWLPYPLYCSALPSVHSSYTDQNTSIARMLAALASFLTPIVYQTNMLVYGSGGYRFTDFMRVGISLNLSTGLLASAIIPFMWPLSG